MPKAREGPGFADIKEAKEDSHVSMEYEFRTPATVETGLEVTAAAELSAMPLWNGCNSAHHMTCSGYHLTFV